MDKTDRLQEQLIEELKRARFITRPEVDAAFRAAPRHLFLPDLPVAEVYTDKAIPTKYESGVPISSSSQPAIMAIMLEQLQLAPDEHVLEIGAGTGYNAALMGHLLGPAGRVTTIDIDQDIVDQAQAHLQQARTLNVDVICADGGYGYPPAAPYNAIIATVGVWDISPHWLEQLCEGGRMVLPLSLRTLQFSTEFEKRGERLVSTSIRQCGFMPLRGAFAGPMATVQIGPITVGAEDAGQLKPTLANLLEKKGREQHLFGASGDIFRSLVEYIALHSSTFFTLIDYEKEKFDQEFSFAMMAGDTGLAILLPPAPENGHRVSVRVYGDDAGLALLNQLIVDWEGWGRPALERATITAAPLGSMPILPDELVIPKKWMEYHIRY
ncbi:MAG: methyltransferase domain-containing protein [Anaerolineae bacterium]